MQPLPNKERIPPKFKTYEVICIIVILLRMSTKALHLEVGTDLTTNAYLAEFRKFTSRGSQRRSFQFKTGANLIEATRVFEGVWQQVSSDYHLVSQSRESQAL